MFKRGSYEAMHKSTKGKKLNIYLNLIIPLIAMVLLLAFALANYNQKNPISSHAILNEKNLQKSSLDAEVGISAIFQPPTETKGYIIELKNEPFLKKSYLGINYKKQLDEEHLAAKQQIENILGKKINVDIKFFGEFQDTFNGITLDISKEECELVKARTNLVKACYPNLKVHTLLDKSISVTGANLAYPNFNLTGKNVVIAVIDTGIDASHESLDDLDDSPETKDPKVIGWKDYVNFKSMPYDDHGHGTHCAGIAAGTGGVPLGTESTQEKPIYRGIAPQAKLVGVKVLDSGGSGTFSDVIAGIEWVIQNKDRYNITLEDIYCL